MNTISDNQLATELRLILTRLIKKLRKKSPISLSLSLTERSTLSLLEQHGELLPGELAGMEKITNQSMSQILNTLGDLGYISRKISEDDKRKSIISLSSKGASMLKQMRSERETWLYQAIAKTLSAKEIEKLKSLLQPLSRLVEYEE